MEASRHPSTRQTRPAGTVSHLALLGWPLLLVVTALSGLRGGSYSLDHLQAGAPPLLLALLMAWLGAVLATSPLQSRLPGNTPVMKGWLAGLLALAVWPACCMPLHLEPLDVAMALLLIPAGTVLLAMQRGKVPAAVTRRALPLPLAWIALAAGLWIMARFV